MKPLYTFTVKVGKEKAKITFIKPSHSNVEDAEYVYGQKFNQLMNDGYLSRAMMTKRFDDIGGMFSDTKVEETSKQIKELFDVKRIIEFWEGAENISEEKQKELDKAKETFIALEKRLIEKDVQLEQMYSQSADAKAEEYLVKWFVLNKSFFSEKVKKGDKVVEELFPLFEGLDFKEKQEQLDILLEEVEDDDGDILKKKKKIVDEALVILQRVVTLWYNGLAKDQKTTEEALEKFFPPEPDPKEVEKKEKDPNEESDSK